jgi:hypothetical protein
VDPLLPKRVVVTAVVVALVLVAGGVVAWRVLSQRSTYEQAVSWLPASTLRASYTDWAQVRSEAAGTSLGPASSRAEINRFLERAYDKDLSFASAVNGSTYVLMHRFGFSPLDARWEVYGQSRKGSVDVLQLVDSVDMQGIERNLRTLGYAPPAGGIGTSGVWTGGPDLVSRISSALTPVQQNVLVLADQHVVLMSDSASYASSSAEVVRGSSPGLSTVAGVEDLAVIPSDPATAVLWGKDFACEDLSMGAAEDSDEQTGKALVLKAGGINPLAGLVMAQGADRRIVVGMHFENSDQASANLQPRVDLASGAAPGQGGSFADRFRVLSGKADGSDVVLQLKPRGGTVLSDISQGPVLFATC